MRSFRSCVFRALFIFILLFQTKLEQKSKNCVSFSALISIVTRLSLHTPMLSFGCALFCFLFQFVYLLSFCKKEYTDVKSDLVSYLLLYFFLFVIGLISHREPKTAANGMRRNSQTIRSSCTGRGLCVWK